MIPIYLTKDRHIGLAWVDRLSITVITGNVSDVEWLDMLQLANTYAPKSGVRLCFIDWYNGNATAAQRKATIELGGGNDEMEAMVMVSDSAVTRGALTAYNWLRRQKLQLRAYPPTGVADAFQWLQTQAPFSAADAKDAYQRLLNVLRE